MKSFAIVGAGALGSYYGARLAEAGNEVRFLLRSDYDEVKHNGLKVESIHGDIFLPQVLCGRTPEEIGEVDVVMVCWKTTSNEHYEDVIAPMLHEKSIVLTMQNGLGNTERLSEIFGAERVMGALCFVCINRLGAGLISHSGGGPIEMGCAVPGVTPELEELAALFEEAKVRCAVSADLGESQWRKLVWNVPFNGLCITEGGIDTKALLAQEGGEAMVRELMAEVIAAANALGYPVEADYEEVQMQRTYPMGPYRPSSMIDFVDGKPVEVEAIWGEPLRRAEAAGAKVPKMAALYERIVELTR
ncbi:MAG: 2-dehydropantoate 2-reductase [Verrucomicrobiaceae bacterium]